MTPTSPPPSPAAPLAAWPSAQRLFTLSGAGAIPQLMVESFVLTDAISEPFVLQLDVLCLDARLDLDALLRQPLTLHAVLADGSRFSRSGLIFEVEAGDANGGFAPYRVLVKPFVSLLGYSSHSRVWQDKTLPQIIDTVLQPYAAVGNWRWGEVDANGSMEDLGSFLARGPNGGVFSY